MNKQQLLRVDLYGGYLGDKKPDPDHRYSWHQQHFETTHDFYVRISEYLADIIEQLDEGDDYDDD